MKQKVVTVDHVTEEQLGLVREMLVGGSSSVERTGAEPFDPLPRRTKRIVATTAAFIQQHRAGFFLAEAAGPQLRIHCGRLIVMTATPDSIWLAVTEAAGASRVGGLASWSWDEHSYPRYKRTVPSRNGFYAPSMDPSGAEWEAVIAPAFFDYVDVICARGAAPDHRTSSTPGLLDEIAGWSAHDAVSASFEQAVRIARAASPEQRRARLRDAPVHPRVVRSVVERFQRNADVAAEVLSRAAGTCELCGHPAPFTRASDGTPYLEVHHRVRLADGGDDTVGNAVAACPNCHRRAHLG